MRIGVLSTWLSRRYQPFWLEFLRALGQELVWPASSPAVLDLPLGRSGRKVAAQALSLRGQVDFLLLPDIQLGEESARVMGCWWSHDLRGSLEEAISGLPSPLVVRGELGPWTLREAVEIGQSLVHNAQLLQRALDQTRHLIAPVPARERGKGKIGLAAEPYLLEDPDLYPELSDYARQRGWELRLASGSPEELRREGKRLELGPLLPSALEFAGMASKLSREGGVAGILLLSDESCPEGEHLAQKIAGHLSRPNFCCTVSSDPNVLAGWP